MEFKLKSTFSASAEELFNNWLNSKGHSAMTGGEAETSAEVGGSFTAWDGYIQGKNVIVEPNRRIVQSWRASEFEEVHKDSQVEILFQELGSGTELTLIHRDLPDSIGEQYRKGWQDFYFTPMAEYFAEKF